MWYEIYSFRDNHPAVGPGGTAGHAGRAPAVANQVVAGQAPGREGGCGIEGEEFVAVSDYFSGGDGDGFDGDDEN